MTPKFEVGEVVILQSVDVPQWNGEYTIHEVFEPFKTYTINGDHCTGDQYAYDLGFKFEHNGLTCYGFNERALRKKHQPGEMSFRDLMQTLKDPSHA